jgi:hypothetical protein
MSRIVGRPLLAMLACGRGSGRRAVVCVVTPPDRTRPGQVEAVIGGGRCARTGGEPPSFGTSASQCRGRLGGAPRARRRARCDERHPMSHPMSRPAPQLGDLLADVMRTRDVHRREQQKRAGSPELTVARQAALGALETYTAALTERRWPIPPRMLQDLRLLRAICGHHPR